MHTLCSRQLGLGKASRVTRFSGRVVTLGDSSGGQVGITFSELPIVTLSTKRYSLIIFTKETTNLDDC